MLALMNIGEELQESRRGKLSENMQLTAEAMNKRTDPIIPSVTASLGSDRHSLKDWIAREVYVRATLC